MRRLFRLPLLVLGVAGLFSADANARPTTLESGRKVVLPTIGTHTWSNVGDEHYDNVMYNDDRGSASVWVTWTAGDTCEAEKRKRRPKPLERAMTKARGLEVVWHGRNSDTIGGYAEELCVRGKGISVLAVITEQRGPTKTFDLLRQLALDIGRSQIATAKSP